MNAEKFTELIRSHATFVHHRRPDGATISRDMRTAARLIGELTEQVKQLESTVEDGLNLLEKAREE